MQSVEEENSRAAMLHGQSVEEMRVDLSGELDATPTTESGESGGGSLSAWLPKEGMDAFRAGAGSWLPAKGTTVAREWMSGRRANLKPWREFFKTDRFGAPPGPAGAVKRVASNINSFQSNYMCVFVGLFLFCVLTSPMLLLALGACGALVYLVRSRSGEEGRLKLGGRELSRPAQYGLVAALSFPLFWLAGAGSAIFWVIGASVFAILLHAGLYANEEIPGADFLTQDV